MESEPGKGSGFEIELPANSRRSINQSAPQGSWVNPYFFILWCRVTRLISSMQAALETFHRQSLRICSICFFSHFLHGYRYPLFFRQPEQETEILLFQQRGSLQAQPPARSHFPARARFPANRKTAARAGLPLLDACERLVGLAAKSLQEVFRKKGYVVLAAPQGRDFDFDYFEPEIKIVSKLLPGDFFQQILMGCRNQPEIDGDVPVAADPVETLSCENPEQIHLHLSGISPISSRKRVPPPAISNRPFWVRAAPVKSRPRGRKARFRAVFR